MRSKWETGVDIATLAWLILLLISAFTDSAAITACLAVIAVFFVIELALAFRRRESFWQFLKSKWIDILLLIPFVRVLRVGRLARLAKLHKLIRIARLEAVLEWFDFLSKGAERIRRLKGGA